MLNRRRQIVRRLDYLLHISIYYFLFYTLPQLIKSPRLGYPLRCLQLELAVDARFFVEGQLFEIQGHLGLHTSSFFQLLPLVLFFALANVVFVTGNLQFGTFWTAY